jgi:hypothetical protein
LEFDYTPILIFATVALYGMGYLFGGLAGRIIIINKYPSVLVEILSGILIIGSATFVVAL